MNSFLHVNRDSECRHRRRPLKCIKSKWQRQSSTIYVIPQLSWCSRKIDSNSRSWPRGTDLSSFRISSHRRASLSIDEHDEHDAILQCFNSNFILFEIIIRVRRACASLEQKETQYMRTVWVDSCLRSIAAADYSRLSRLPWMAKRKNNSSSATQNWLE